MSGELANPIFDRRERSKTSLDPLLKALANYVFEAREHSKISQKELGEVLGVSRDTIRRWEWGQAQPGLKEIIKIGQATGLAFKDMPPYLGDARKIRISIIYLDKTNGEIEVNSDIFAVIDEVQMPFAVLVGDDSMEEMGIYNGDTVVVNPAERPEDGECALVCFRARWSVRGVLMNRDGTIMLKAGKPHYDMVVSSEEIADDSWFRILGKVVLSKSERKPKRF